MAHFSRVRVFGLWVVNSTLLPTEMELFDAQLSKAINGDEGGVWAPSSLIEVGGSGIKITGPFVVTSEAQLQGGATVTGGNLSVADDANIQGNATVGGTLEVTGETTITDDLNVGNDATIQGELEVDGATNLGDNLSVDGSIQATGGVTASGDLSGARLALAGSHEGANKLTVRGNSYFDGSVSIVGGMQMNGSATLNADLIVQGVTQAKGRFRKRMFTVSADSAQVVNIADYDIVRLPAGVLTVDRVLTVETTNAVAGDVMRVFTEDTTNFLEVQASAVNTPIKRLSGSIAWLELIYTGSAWVTSAFSEN